MIRFSKHLAALPIALLSLPAHAQVVHNTGVTISDADTATADLYVDDDTTLDGQVCIGYSCSSTETYDTGTMLKLRSATTSILFEDSSTTSLPDRDWRLQANDTVEERFFIEDETSGTIPFSIEGAAPTNALWLDATGNIGFGTKFPQRQLHVVDGGVPTLRLDQDGSNGNTPQTYDITAHNFGFSIADLNTLRTPFSIREGAPSHSIFAGSDGQIGLGTSDPSAALHVERSDGTAGILVEETNASAAARGLLTLRNNGKTYFTLEDTSIVAGNNTGRLWNFQNNGGNFRVTTAPGGPGEIEMNLDVNGNLSVEGNFISGTTQLNVPDYVFEPGYDLLPLAEVRSFVDTNGHLPNIPSAEILARDGLNISEMQMELLRKVEELTLYTLAQEERIAELTATVTDLRVQVSGLEN